jgi:RNA polymerase sigma-70 factor (ECF subfamily)
MQAAAKKSSSFGGTSPGRSLKLCARQVAPSSEPPQKRMKRLDDSQLIEKLQQGSEEAFMEMFEQYKGRIFNVVYRILGEPSDCEDVVQEVFLKAYRNIGSFNHQSALYTWLYRIGVNAAVDYKKKYKRPGVVSLYRQDGTMHDFTSDMEGPDADPQRREMAALLKEALDQLSEKHRTILILREFEGLSYEEISEVLDCSKGTVESRLFRARGRLREKLEKFLW